MIDCFHCATAISAFMTGFQRKRMIFFRLFPISFLENHTAYRFFVSFIFSIISIFFAFGYFSKLKTNRLRFSSVRNRNNNNNNLIEEIMRNGAKLFQYFMIIFFLRSSHFIRFVWWDGIRVCAAAIWRAALSASRS